MPIHCSATLPRSLRFSSSYQPPCCNSAARIENRNNCLSKHLPTSEFEGLFEYGRVRGEGDDAAAVLLVLVIGWVFMVASVHPGAGMGGE
jgi:hypothetical protein